MDQAALLVFLALRLQSPPQQEDCLAALVVDLVAKHRQLLAGFLVTKQHPLLPRVNRHQPVDYLAHNQLEVIRLRKVRSLVHLSHSRMQYWQELRKNLLLRQVVVA